MTSLSSVNTQDERRRYILYQTNDIITHTKRELVLAEYVSESEDI